MMPSAAPWSALLDVFDASTDSASTPTGSVRRVVGDRFRELRSELGFTPASPTGAHDNMVALVTLQRADGSWNLNGRLALLIGHKFAALESASSGATGAVSEVRKAWATALALAWLGAHAGPFEGEWKLAADKARRWLSTLQSRPPGGGEWLDAAVRLLSTVSS